MDSIIVPDHPILSTDGLWMQDPRGYIGIRLTAGAPRALQDLGEYDLRKLTGLQILLGISPSQPQHPSQPWLAASLPKTNAKDVLFISFTAITLYPDARRCLVNVSIMDTRRLEDMAGLGQDSPDSLRSMIRTTTFLVQESDESSKHYSDLGVTLEETVNLPQLASRVQRLIGHREYVVVTSNRACEDGIAHFLHHCMREGPLAYFSVGTLGRHITQRRRRWWHHLHEIHNVMEHFATLNEMLEYLGIPMLDSKFRNYSNYTLRALLRILVRLDEKTDHAHRSPSVTRSDVTISVLRDVVNTPIDDGQDDRNVYGESTDHDGRQHGSDDVYKNGGYGPAVLLTDCTGNGTVSDGSDGTESTSAVGELAYHRRDSTVTTATSLIWDDDAEEIADWGEALPDAEGDGSDLAPNPGEPPAQPPALGSTWGLAQEDDPNSGLMHSSVVLEQVDGVWVPVSGGPHWLNIHISVEGFLNHGIPMPPGILYMGSFTAGPNNTPHVAFTIL